MSKKDDLSDLAPDASLATDLGDEKERTAEQLAHFGGEVDPDIDDEDFSAADRGDEILDEEELEARRKAAEEEAAKKGKDDVNSDADADVDDDSEGDDSEEDKKGSEDDDAGEEESDDEGDEDDADDEGDEEEGEEEAAKPKKGKGDDSDEGDRKPVGIPKHRFDEVNERMKAAEKKLAGLEAASAAAKKAEEEAFDFDTAEKEYIELVQDGKTDEALAKRKEINQAHRAELKREAEEDTEKTVDSKATEREINALSQQAETLYPVFDADHEDYDSKITGQVMAFWRGYASSGELSLGDAFVTAVADVVDLHELDSRYGEEKEEEEEEAPKKKAPKKDTKKKLEAAKKQQPPLGDAGKGSKDVGAAVPNIEEMSDEEFDALPESTKAKLRGDFI